MTEHGLMGSSTSASLERLLEESWDLRSAPASRRALLVDAVASGLFVAAAVPLAVTSLGGQHLRVGLAALLVGLYAVFSRSIRVPVGAGSFVPSYLVLVPMLVLLPPGVVPLLAALGIVLGTLLQCALRGARLEKVLLAVPDAWFSLGPALVLTVAGLRVGDLASAPVLLGAFVAGCVLDLIVSTVREWLSETVIPSLQVRVIMVVWAIDAVIAPLGVLVAYAARRDAHELFLLLPLGAVLMVVNHDRNLRIAQSRQRLKLAADEHERVRLAVKRVGEALSAKLELGALGNVVLGAALDVVSADCGYLVLGADLQPVIVPGRKAEKLHGHLDTASSAAWANAEPYQVESDGGFALAMPLSVLGRSDGVVALARRARAFEGAERQALEDFIRQVERAAADGASYDELRLQTLTDPLTGIGNRRKLIADLSARLSSAKSDKPLLLALFDLDGFKGYNDHLGRAAGDALLTTLASRLAAAVADDGAAYRLGGDEFCILVNARSPSQVAAASDALTEHTTSYQVTPSFGSVLVPREARTLEQALSLADQRMYQHKRERAKQSARSSTASLFRIAG
jgi:diguanylate cyclase (GGDEF)-like protein